MTATVLSRLDHRMSTSFQADARSLAMFRIIYSSGILAFGLAVNWSTIAWPSVFLDPAPGPYALVPIVPPGWFLDATWLIFVVALAMVLVGAYTAQASWAVSILGVWGAGLFYSFGKIDHGFPILIVAAIMARSGWGDTWSFDAHRARPARGDAGARSLFQVAFLIVLLMASAALPKIIAGWLDPSTQAARAYFLQGFDQLGRTRYLAAPAAEISSWLLWEVIDWATIVVELSPLLLLGRPGWFRRALWILGGFHLSILMVMNISFASNLLIYAALVPWVALLGSSRPNVRTWQLMAVAGVLIVASLNGGVVRYIPSAVRPAWGWLPYVLAMLIPFAVLVVRGHHRRRARIATV